MKEWKFLFGTGFNKFREAKKKILERKDKCKKIKNIVENGGMELKFPLVKYDKHILSQKRYYLGLAINAVCENEEELLGNAKLVLRQAGITVLPDQNNLDFLCPVSEIGKKFLSGSVDDNLSYDNIVTESFTTFNRIEKDEEKVDWVTESSYPETDDSEQVPRLSSQIIPHEPFEMLYSEPAEEQTLLYNRLLWWASAYGSGSISRLHESCLTLDISKSGSDTWSLLRRMALISHTKVKRQNTVWRWEMMKPVLVRKPGKESESFLVGLRTPRLLKEIESRFQIHKTEQYKAPTRIVLNYSDKIDLASGERIDNLGCISEEMASALPSLEKWAQGLYKWEERDFTNYKIEHYKMEEDIFGENSFSNGVFEDRLYRFTRTISERQFSVLAVYDSENKCFKCGDYYSLRYLVKSIRRLCSAFWQKKTNELLVPLSERWPLTYERVIVLASGLIPLRKKDRSGGIYLSYSSLTDKLVDTLSQKLKLNLYEV